LYVTRCAVTVLHRTVTVLQDRLFRLHLLELPLLLRWALHAVTPLLHPNTRR